MNRAYTTLSMRVSEVRWVQWLVAVVVAVSLMVPVWPVAMAHADQDCHECCPERVGPAPVHQDDGVPQCCLVQAPTTPPTDAGVVPPVAPTVLLPVDRDDVPAWLIRVDTDVRAIADISPPAPDRRTLRTVVLLI